MERATAKLGGSRWAVRRRRAGNPEPSLAGVRGESMWEWAADEKGFPGGTAMENL